ncbi:O-antigen ligase family protein [Eubacterium sp. MSJ-33]|uniref:O-antigen ligase family protein n=1 Tax=Eubacterium sp. MSJ-33 TaxID=2841528 RepID=UPI001C768C28|nr:O-antigen ligase family protein [Eubacterium sp. MSJ-33]QWT52212.1 O-antigen ligase family protein [Eubacterium sp. MSJ-33]
METIVYFICFVCLLNSSFFSINIGPVVFDVSRISLIIFIMFYLARNKFILHLHKFKTIQKIVIFPFVLIVISIIQLLWTKDYTEWFKVVFTLIIALLYFILVPIVIDDNQKVLKCLKCFYCASLVQLALGYLEMFTGKYLFVGDVNYIKNYQKEYNSLGLHSPAAMNLNSNNYSTMILIGCCIGLILFLNSKKRYMKIFYMIMFLLSGFSIYCTDSRANMIAFLLLIGLYVFFFLKNKAAKLLVIGLLVMMILLVIPYFDGFFISPDSDSTRMQLYMDGFVFLKKTYLLGIGPGQEEWWFLHKRVYSWGGVRVMHNYLLEILVCFGLPGFIWFMYSYIKAFRVALRTFIYRSDLAAKIGCGISLFLITFIVSSLSASTLIRSEYIWLLYSIIFSYVNNTVKGEE